MDAWQHHIIYAMFGNLSVEQRFQNACKQLEMVTQKS